jgi:DNA gyrase/topoisomerase IV subunit A
MDSISIYGRATQGVKIMRINEDEKLVSITKVVEEETSADLD